LYLGDSTGKSFAPLDVPKLVALREDKEANKVRREPIAFEA
jgi:hypothetical protein